MTLNPANSKTSLALANRILAHEGVLDAFGHVSLRNPADPTRFWLARSLAPELVTEADILEFGPDSEPISPTDAALYSERIIHGAIYAARPDVHAVCHHHAPEILPFTLAPIQLRVVTQLGAIIGRHIPIWDQRLEFGATNHLVMRQQEAASLAGCLGSHAIVLMRRHGATVIGASLRELVFRCIYSCRDADLQLRAGAYGEVDHFTETEIDLAGRFPEATLARAWEYWCSHLPTDSTFPGETCSGNR